MAKILFLAFRMLLLVTALTGLLAPTANAQGYAGQFAWQTNNTSEPILTPANVNSGQFGKVFSYPVDGSIFAQPLYVPGVVIPNQGTHNVVYVVTESDGIYAFDADGLQSTPLWYVSLINPAQGITAPNCYAVVGPCNIYPTIGITGTPVIDPVSGTMYFDAMTLEKGTYFHRLHALDITTGAEKFGGPAVIQASASGKGLGNVGGVISFIPQHEVNRPGLLLMNGVVYIALGGGSHGWLLGYNATTLAQLYVLLLSPNAYASGVWMTGEGLQTDGLGNIYLATDDAPFDANTGTKDDYGDTLLKLSSSLAIEDYFTPMDQACRLTNDLDLGSAGPLIVPTQSGPYPNEIIMAGKGGTPCDLWSGGVYAAPIYVVNQDNMGKYNSTQDQVIQEVEGSPHGYWSNAAYWASATTNYVYSAGVDAWGGSGDYLKMYSLINGLLSTTPVAQSTAVLPVGATPFVSANGTSNGIVWAAERQDSLSVLPGSKPVVLLAYNAANVADLLYSSTQNAARDTAGLETKFEVPLVANGRVYVGTQTELDAYGPLNSYSATLLPASLSWGIIAIGSASQPKTATLTNTSATTMPITSISVTGTKASEFPITANTCGSSLGAGLSCAISVEFKPNAEGTQSATLTVVDGAGTQTAALTGSGTAVKFAPPSLTFTSLAVGLTSAPQTSTMTNLSSSAITITSIAIGGADPLDFAQTNTCGSSLAANSSCVITVTFSPTAIGTRTANVTVTDSDVTSPQKLILTGTGTAANVSYTVLPTSIAFPSVNVGLQSSCQPVVVTNTGSTTLTVSSFTLTPFLDFQLQYGYAPKTLSPTQTSTYCIKFAPQAAQAYTGQLSISIQGVANPSIVTFTGTGVQTTAAATVTPNVLTFAPQPLGTTTSQTVTVKNTGHAAFHLSSITNQPPFSYSGFTTSVAIQPNASFSFQVNFTPTQAVSYTNATYLALDILPSQSVSMTGSGTAPTSLAVTSFPTLPSVTQNATYLANLAAAGGNGALTWSLATGSTLPKGLTLSSAGSITGTPASTVAVGTYTFTAKVTDSSAPPKTATATFTLPVAAYVTGAKCSNIDWDVAGTSNPLVALPDLGTGTYLGYEGGLYPNGQNTPPPAQLATALGYAQNIAAGQSPYVMISVGVSITRTIWDEFGPMEAADPALNHNLVLVNAAIDGTDSPDWTSPTSGTWLTITNYYLPYQNVTPNQVVAAWIMMPHSNQSGTYPSDMQNQENDLIAILQNLHTYFPNLQLAYISSLHYGGYQPSNSYPEPYAYEFGLAVQNVIADQIDGNPALNNNPANGPVMAPLLLWGPYTWSNGLLGRSDGLTWDCQDVTSDGLHPSAIGRNKNAGLLSTFFRSDPTAVPWFLQP